MVKKIKSIALFTPFLLSACEDDSKECERLAHDENKQTFAFSYCERAANDGDSKSQVQFAKLLLTQKETEQAVRFLEKSANQKNGEAMFLLGQLYENGEGVEKKIDTATFYYEESCKYNELKGCEHSRRLTQQVLKKERADELALEKAKATRLEAEAKAEEQSRLSEEARQRKAETDALKAKVGNRKFYYGLAKYQEGSLWGHINQKGEMVIPAQWAYAANFFEGLAAVKTTEGKWGFIDTKGNYKITPRFACVIRFNEGLAGVAMDGYGEYCQGGKWGFVDKEGNWKLSPSLDKIESSFKNGVAKVVYNGETQYINKQFERIEYQDTSSKTASNPYPMTAYQVKDLYSNFNKTYKEFGIAGLSNWSENCYAKSKNKIGCYHFDQLAALVDMAVSKENNFPQSEFFQQNRVELRAIRHVPEFKDMPSATFRVVIDETIKEISKNAQLFSL